MIKDIKNFTSTMSVLKDLMDMSTNPQKMEETLSQLEEQIKSYRPKMNLTFVNKSDNPDPTYAYGSDSGFDLLSNVDTVIPPNSRSIIPTGLFFDIPYGYEIQVRPKSGLAINMGLTVLNTPGTVDKGYTGEIKVIVFNTNNNSVVIEKGMKIAQAVLCPVVCGKFVNFEQTDNLGDSERGDAGFGSTGI